jgi:hypothetical protein
LQVNQTGGGRSERPVRFNTDSHSLLGIDNRCSKSISPDPLDFIGKVKNTNRAITRFGGSKVTGIKRGTIQWHWEDDTGQVRQFDIPGLYYVLNAKQRLMSPPQHVTQVMKKKASTRGLVCKNDTNVCQLRWNDGKNTQTVPINRFNICVTLGLAPGFQYFMAYCAKFDLDTSSNNTKLPIASATLIEHEEDEVKKTCYLIPWIPIVKKMKQPYLLTTPALGNQQNDQYHVIPSEDDEQHHELIGSYC